MNIKKILFSFLFLTATLTVHTVCWANPLLPFTKEKSAYRYFNRVITELAVENDALYPMARLSNKRVQSSEAQSALDTGRYVYNYDKKYQDSMNKAYDDLVKLDYRPENLAIVGSVNPWRGHTNGMPSARIFLSIKQEKNGSFTTDLLIREPIKLDHVPSDVPDGYFAQVNGLTDNWFSVLKSHPYPTGIKHLGYLDPRKGKSQFYNIKTSQFSLATENDLRHLINQIATSYNYTFY